MILHIDLDAFFASVEQRDNPKLRDKPVIVGGPAPFFPNPIQLRSLPRVQRGVVATASYEARRYGVHSGMPLFKAKILCPHAIFIPTNFVKYEEASNKFIEICSSYSPTLEQISLDELYIDLTGTDMLWPSPSWVAQQIQSRVKREIGITCSVGIAAQKIVAKVASGLNKPNGVTYVALDKEAEFLAPLPLEKLPGCGERTREILRSASPATRRCGASWRIKKIGDLAQMHPGHVRLLLGKRGIFLWEIANGMDTSRVTPPRSIQSVSRSTTFSFDTSDCSFVEAMLFYLAQRVAQNLREEHIGGKCVAVTIRTAEFETSLAQSTILASIATAHAIFNMARGLLYKLWDGCTKLRLVGVGVSHLLPEADQPVADNQLKCPFHLIKTYYNSDKWLAIEQAMDKVRNKHGFLSITPASLMKLRGVYPNGKECKRR